MFLTLIDINAETGINLSSKIANSVELSKDGLGGGFIGTVFGYIFIKLFGSVGSYIVIAFIILISLLLFTEIRIKDFTNRIKFRKEKLLIQNPILK